jgi:hypothetical protein
MDWRDGLLFHDRVDVMLKVRNVDPRAPEALAIAIDEWRAYTYELDDGVRHLNDFELECTARDSLAEIISKRERT